MLAILKVHSTTEIQIQLHAANVELIALENAEIKYSTVQKWYPGDEDGKWNL